MVHYTFEILRTNLKAQSNFLSLSLPISSRYAVVDLATQTAKISYLIHASCRLVVGLVLQVSAPYSSEGALNALL